MNDRPPTGTKEWASHNYKQMNDKGRRKFIHFLASFFRLRGHIRDLSERLEAAEGRARIEKKINGVLEEELAWARAATAPAGSDDLVKALTELTPGREISFYRPFGKRSIVIRAFKRDPISGRQSTKSITNHTPIIEIQRSKVCLLAEKVKTLVGMMRCE